MVKKVSEVEKTVGLWARYAYLRKPVDKIRRLAEIAHAASTSQIQVPVQRTSVDEKGVQVSQTVLSDPHNVGQYEEILRILLMKYLNSCDLDGV